MSILTFGMESYRSSIMEDDINIDVNVGAGTDSTADAIEEAAETDVATADAAETTDNIEEAADAAEEMFKRMDRMDAISDYIRRYGVDNRLMMLHDYDGFISHGLSIRVPGNESYGPSSRVAYAALEGIGDAAKSVWEWIKKMCRKIREFFQELWVKFLNIFSNKKKQIARLRAILKKRRDKDKDDIDGKTISGWEKNNASGAAKAIEDGETRALLGTGRDVSDIENVVKKATEKQRDELVVNSFERSMNDIDKSAEAISDVDWSLDDLEVDNAVSRAGSCLSDAESVIDLKELDRSKKDIDKKSKDVEKLASDYSRKTEDMEKNGKIAKYLRSAANVLNKRSSLAAKVISARNKLASIYIKTASGFIAKGTVSRS